MNDHGRQQSIKHFWAHVPDRPEGGCWPWAGETRNGYGRFRSPYWAGNQEAHRIAYLIAVGPIEPGLELDHTCHSFAPDPCVAGNACAHRACVNPAHLEPVTHAENKRRAQAQRDYCKNGHLREPRDQYGARRCVECNRDAQRRFRERHASRKVA